MTDTDPTTAPLAFDNTFAATMEGFYKAARPAPVAEARLIAFNDKLAAELGIDRGALDDAGWARALSGQEPLPGAEPIAQAYAGHQFGHFVPQLGDGRALLLGEVIGADGRRRDVQLKGSGPTHFSRGGDGLSPLGPVLREYLVSEAMHALGVPTTRALAAVSTGQTVYREEPLPGAVFTRVATSHLRVGTFQYFAARGEIEQLRRLADYAIGRHDPQLAGTDDRYLAFLQSVCNRQAALVAHWMSLGFVHGVMNTDNTSISGETIDYGPCAFMEPYDPGTVFSSIDRNGRYCYGRQPRIVLWNLARLAETLIPLIGDDQDAAIAKATEIVETVGPTYEREWFERLRAKLGLSTAQDGDWELVEAWHNLMHTGDVDFTNAFRALASAAEGSEQPLRTLFATAPAIDGWLAEYRTRLANEAVDAAERAAAMRAVNPAFIPRNERVEEAIEHAVRRDDFEPFRALLAVVTRPFDDQPGRERFAQPAPADDEPYVTFCGT
ncbi:MAG: YdiU family protein [Planctomycetota bacterium]